MNFSIIVSLLLVAISFLSFLMFVGQNQFKGYILFSIVVFCLAAIWIEDDIGRIGVLVLAIAYAALLVLLWMKFRAQMFTWWTSFSGFETDLSEVVVGESGSTITSLKKDGSLRYKGKKYFALSKSIDIPANYSVKIVGISGYYLEVEPN